MNQVSGLGLAGREIQTLLEVGVTGSLSDGQLLDRFVVRREEAIFRAILLRHGAMIWGVCGRILGNHHDAEDAFQATCLVLANKAGSVYPQEKLGVWLHGVALQTALKARQNRTKRQLREGREITDDLPIEAEIPDQFAGELDRVLNKLPEKYRVPIVLCELEGKSHKEAAEVLGWPIGTVSGRLSRGKNLLADRLVRSGVTLSMGAILGEGIASAAVPVRLIDATSHVVCSGGAGVVSGTVMTLTQEISRAMMISKVKVLATIVVTGAILTAGGVGLVGSAQSQEGAATKKAAAASAVVQDPPPIRETQKVVVPQDEVAKIKPAIGRPAREMPGRGRMPGGLSAGIFGGGAEPLYFRSGNFVYVTSPKNDTFTIYNIKTGKSSTVRVPAENGPVRQISWVQSGAMLVLDVTAPKVTRLEVYGMQTGKWYTQELRAPATTRPEPLYANRTVAYVVGRYVYAFSLAAEKWGVIELPEGLINNPTVTDSSVTMDANGHLYDFDSETGVWKDTDLRKAIQAAIEAEKKSDNK